MEVKNFEIVGEKQIITLEYPELKETVACTLPLGPLDFGFKGTNGFITIYQGTASAVDHNMQEKDMMLVIAGTESVLRRTMDVLTLLLSQADLSFEASLSVRNGQNVLVILYNTSITDPERLTEDVTTVFQAVSNSKVSNFSEEEEERILPDTSFTYVSDETEEVTHFQSTLTDENALVQGIAGNDV